MIAAVTGRPTQWAMPRGAANGVTPFAEPAGAVTGDTAPAAG
jgi:hypothetical protein